MGIFARLATLIKSNLNDLISRSEDPEKMLNQVVIDMANQLIEAKKQVAVSIADEKRLAKQAEQEASQRRRVGAPRDARHQGRRRRARQGGARPQEGARRRSRSRSRISGQKQKNAVEQLKTALRMLNNKIEEAKRKKNVLIARKKRAEAQRAIQETMSGMNNVSAFETFDRMSTEDRRDRGGGRGVDRDRRAVHGRHARGEVRQAGADGGRGRRPRRAQAQDGRAAAGGPQARGEARAHRGAPGRGREAPHAVSQAEQDELAAALAELEAQEQQEQARMKR